MRGGKNYTSQNTLVCDEASMCGHMPQTTRSGVLINVWCLTKHQNITI